MREIVTLQLGNRANYLATHFWNTQESYFTYPTPTDPTPAPSPVDHDINFRPGIGADGSDTYTPRTLIYDFQPNFGTLRKLNALYEALRPDEAVRGLWDGIQQTQVLTPIPPIPYQVNLESGLPTPQLYSNDVRYWSDFNRLFYHPRSILPLSQQSLSSSLNATETWANGVELFKDLDREVDLLDRDVRPFVEECDSLSSFQIFSSVDDSWGGYACSYVEALREEYGKKGIWVWAIEDSSRVERSKQYQRLANSARSLRTMSQEASAYIRMSNIPSSLPECIQLETNSEWSTAALMSAAMESVTLPARLRNDGRTTTANINTFEDILNTNGSQNVWTLQARVRSNTTPPQGQSSNRPSTTTGRSGSSQTSDLRMRPTPSTTTAVSSNIENIDPEPSTFDIDYTPTTPTPHTTFPSLRTNHIPHHHTFAQFESHRTASPSSSSSSSPHSTTYLSSPSSTPILAQYSTPLPYPLLTSYPATLFHLPRRNGHVLVDAALSTMSRSRTDVLALRDVVAGSVGRSLALVDGGDEEVEVLYDELTRVADGFVFGWEGSDGDEEGGDGGDDYD